MFEPGGDPDLVQEPLRTDHRGEVGTHYLDADQTVVLQITGEVDGGHPTTAKLSLDGIAVGERSFEVSGDLAHGAKMDRLRGFGESSSRSRIPIPATLNTD